MRKNKIQGAMNLHELATKSVEAVHDHVRKWMDRNTLRQETLLPVFQILTDYIPEVAFVNGIKVFKIFSSWSF